MTPEIRGIPRQRKRHLQITCHRNKITIKRFGTLRTIKFQHCFNVFQTKLAIKLTITNLLLSKLMTYRLPRQQSQSEINHQRVIKEHSRVADLGLLALLFLPLRHECLLVNWKKSECINKVSVTYSGNASVDKSWQINDGKPRTCCAHGKTGFSCAT